MSSSTPFWHSVLPDGKPIDIHDDLPEVAHTVVIGCGLTGLSCALTLARRLRQRQQNQLVVAVDARSLCDGATARNGGLAYPEVAERGDEVSAALSSIEKHDMAEVRKFIDTEFTKNDEHAHNVSNIALFTTGGLNLGLEEKNKPFQCDYACNADLTFINNQTLESTYGIHGAVGGAVETPAAAQFCPAALLLALKDLLLDAGGRIRTGARVVAVDKVESSDSPRWIVRLADNSLILCSNVVHASNGLGLELLPPRLRSAVRAVKGHCIAVKMPKGMISRSLLFHGSEDSHGEHLIQRKDDGIVVIGGCRHLASSEGELQDLNEKAEPAVSEALKHQLERLFPGIELDVINSWAGTMCFSQDGQPLVGAIKELPRQFVSIAYNGHGMVRAFSCGRFCAENILGCPELTCPTIKELFTPDRIK